MKLILYLIIIVTSIELPGQVITVSDAETEEKLEFVNIISSDPRAITVTNALGQASISLFESSEEISIQLL